MQEFVAAPAPLPLPEASTPQPVLQHRPEAASASRPRFMLTRPDHFEIAYAINPFMHPDAVVDRAAAAEQWGNLRSKLLAAGASVIEQAPAPGCPDHVFAANAALVLGQRALLARFVNVERSGEVGYNRRTFEELGYEVCDLPRNLGAFEGAADAIPFGDRLVVAHGQRTSATTHTALAAFSELPLEPVRLVDPRFYHLDLAFRPLDANHALMVPAAMDAASLDALRRLVPKPLLLTEEEACRFCANCVVVGRRVFMHDVPERVGQMLRAAGFEPHVIPSGEFVKSGGSLACMSLRLNPV